MPARREALLRAATWLEEQARAIELESFDDTTVEECVDLRRRSAGLAAAAELVRRVANGTVQA